ncbi:hypothetical protein AYI69_g11349 [Smittium culicis]|uniref:Uncharacterized protein n=1 Tax=Smittium culicis TaxID=133412 RepID=A0A1R1WZA0_9FUNG|nr:hypothetical protein AYI69_g11349 [Smittium culicis]
MSSETVISEAVIASILNAINDLTSKVDSLTVGKSAEPSVEDDQHISASIPATVLNVYSELVSLIPSKSEDFYRTMLTDEEKKEAIYGCPKSSKVCYNPPPINEAAPGSVKKADAALYAIQSNPNLTLDDPVVDVLNTIRCIMENAASMATQARLDNLYSGMSFTGKPEQVVESEVKPLMESEKFDTQLAAIKPTKRSRVRRPFRGRQQIEGRPSPASSITATAPIIEAAATRPAPNSSRGGFQRGARGRVRGSQRAWAKLADNQWVRNIVEKGFQVPFKKLESNSKDFEENRQSLFEDQNCKASPKIDIDGASPTDNASYAIQAEAQPRGPPEPNGRGGGSTNEEGHRGEDRRTTPSIGSKETEPEPRGNKILDGTSSINLQDNPEKGLYDVLGFEGRIPAYFDTQVVQKVLTFLLERTKLPVPRTNVWSVTKLPYPHKNPAPSSELGTNPENQGSSILGRPDNKNHTPWYDHRQPVYVLESSNDKDSRPTARSRETDKRRQDVAQRPREIYRKGTSDFSGAPTGKINAAPTTGAKEPILNLLLWRDHLKKWNDLSLSAGNPRSRGINRYERYGLGYRHWPQELLWIMEQIRAHTPHQLQGAACSSICLANERNCGSVSSDLLRQYYHPSICKEIWWNYLTRTSQHSGTPVGTLPEDEYQASGNVCSVSSEPSGCSEPLNCTDRVVNFEQDILSIGQEIREARRRTLRIRDQQEGTKILQLVPGPTICGPERAAIQLVELEEPVLLPTLEPDFTGSPEGETRADYDDSNYACMDISDLVSGHTNAIDLPTTNSTSNRGGPRPEKRKVPTHIEQGLDSNCVENQRSALKEKGVSNAAIELILNSQRSVRRRSKYYPIQQKYKD